jgi:lysophospholipase L1-like esterase
MTIRIAVLGDSIAHGIGATHESETPAARLAAALTAASLEVEVRVFAAPGAGSRDLAGQVRRASAWGPEVAVIVIGANDLTHQVRPAAAAGDLRAAVRALRSVPAEVVVAPAPDLSVVPGVPAAMRAGVRAASQALRREQVRAVLEEGGRTADASGDTSPAFARDPRLFSADRFHPSSAGYAVIHEALLPLVLAAARTVRARCDAAESSPG